MKIKTILNAGVLAVCAAAVAAPLTGCSNSKTEKTVEPAEQTEETTAVTDTKLVDGLFTPANVEEGKTYPLIVVIEEEPGAAAEVFTADAFQAETPAYVYVGSDVTGIIDANAVDAARVYSVGKTPDSADVYAASLIVDSAAPKDLKDHKYIFFYTSAEPVNGVEDALRGSGVNYTYAAWGADLPVERQSELAGTMLEKGAPVNIFQFEEGTVPATGATAAAAAIPSVRNWILGQKK